MPPSRPPSDAGNGNLISSLSTCIVGLQRRRDRPESREQRSKQRTDHDSLHSSVTGGPDSHEVASDANRPSEQDKQWESTFPSTTPPPTDRNRRPMPPEDQNYAVHFRPFPQPGSSAVFSMSWQFPSLLECWGSSGRNPWHGRQASRLLPSTTSPLWVAKWRFSPLHLRQFRMGLYPVSSFLFLPISLSTFHTESCLPDQASLRSGCSMYF